MNKGAKIGISTVAVAMLAVAGYGAYNIATAVTGGDTSKSDKPRTVVAEAPGADQAAAGAKAFWRPGPRATWRPPAP